MTPYFFGSSSDSDSMLSGSLSTSTLYSRSASSSGSTGGNLGSSVAAQTAFRIISSAMEPVTGSMVPMQPRSFPRRWRDTNTPALRPVISGGRPSGMTGVSPLMCFSIVILARLT